MKVSESFHRSQKLKLISPRTNENSSLKFTRPAKDLLTQRKDKIITGLWDRQKVRCSSDKETRESDQTIQCLLNQQKVCYFGDKET